MCVAFRRLKCRWTLLMLIIVQALMATTVSADMKRILVLPFTIYAADDMSFLKNGIEAMMNSRLTIEGRQEPVGMERLHAALNSMLTDTGQSTIITAPFQSRSISQGFQSQIKGIAVGDVNGDHLNEIVVIGTQSVFIGRLKNGRLEKIWEMQDPGPMLYVSVDVADINRNGIAEIFITATTGTTEPLNSFVLEYNDSKFNKIVDQQVWYYRVLTADGQNARLIGQKRDLLKDPKHRGRIFRGPVYELKWVDGTYSKAGAFKTQGNASSIYQLALRTPGIPADHNMAVYGENQRLRIMDPDGDLKWESDEPFGRTDNYLEVANPDVRDELLRIYIPARMVYLDADHNGACDLIAVKNFQALGGLFRNSRILDGGRIECLKWNGAEMFPQWQTRKTSKYISDFSVADIDNDGNRELVYAVVKNNQSGINAGKSHIMIEALP